MDVTVFEGLCPMAGRRGNAGNHGAELRSDGPVAGEKADVLEILDEFPGGDRGWQLMPVQDDREDTLRAAEGFQFGHGSPFAAAVFAFVIRGAANRDQDDATAKGFGHMTAPVRAGGDIGFCEIAFGVRPTGQPELIGQFGLEGMCDTAGVLAGGGGPTDKADKLIAAAVVQPALQAGFVELAHEAGLSRG